MIELLIFIGRVVTMNRSGLNYSLHIYKNYTISSGRERKERKERNAIIYKYM